MGELFRDLRDMRDIDEALKVYTGKDMEDLSREWIRFYKKRYYHLLPEKNFDDEEGRQLTFHEKTESSMNIFPAVSPDGKLIAYLTDQNIYASLVIRKLGKKDDPEGKR
jgi:hypothetical protein